MNTETEDRRSTQTPAVDRSDEFDQTRQHIHMERSTCPVPDCREWRVGSRESGVEAEGRHVSPAVWEYRAKQAEYAAKKEAEGNAILRQNVATLKSVLKDRDDAIERLHARIAGFERMTAALAAGVDKAEQMFADLFGMRPEKFVAEHLATENTESTEREKNGTTATAA